MVRARCFRNLFPQRMNRAAAKISTISHAVLGLVLVSANCHGTPKSGHDDVLSKVSPGDKLQSPRLTIQHAFSAAFEVAITTDGQNVLTGSGGQATLWEVSTGRQVRDFQHSKTEEVRALALSGNGRYTVTGGWDGNAILWSSNTGKVLQRFENRGEKIDAVAVANKGTHVFTGDWAGTIILWSASSGQEIRRFSIHRSRVRVLALTPNERFLLSAADDGLAVVWDLATGNALQGFRILGGEITSAAITPDGNYVVTATGDAARLWEVRSGTLLKEFHRISRGSLNQVAISADGRHLVAASGRNLLLWDAVAGRAVHRFDEEKRVTWSMAMTPDGRHLVTVGNFGAVIWDVKTGTIIRKLKGHSSAVWTVALTPDRRYVITGDDNGLHRWDVVRGEQVQMFHPESGSEGGDKAIWSIALTGDGARAVTARWGRSTAILWDVPTGRELRRFLAQNTVRSVAIDAAGRHVVTGDMDGNAVLWDAGSGKELQRFEGHEATVMSVALFADRNRLITGSTDGTARLWDLASGQELNRFVGHEADVVSLALTPDGERLITDGWDGSVRLWNLATGEEIKRLPGHGLGYAPGRLVLIKNGNQLITGDVEGLVRLWDLESGREVRRFEGHRAEITWLDTSSDERHLVTSSWDGTVRIWDVATGAALGTLVGFSDGTWVVSTSDGRFDTNDLEQVRGLHWVTPDDPLRALPMEIFMRDYYEPRLLPRVLAGESLKPVRSLTELNRAQPNIEIASITPERCTPAPCVAETVSVTVAVRGTARAVGEGLTRKSWASGAYDLRLFRDGQLVGQSPDIKEAEPLTGGNLEVDLARWRRDHKIVEGVDTKKVTFRNVRLPRVEGLEEIKFTAYGFNADRVKSNTARKTYSLPHELAPRQGRAYVIAVGVSAYEDPIWNLRFADDDANRLSQVLPARLAAINRYETVVPIILVSNWEVRGGDRVTTVNTATKSNFRAVLDVLAGRREVDEELRRLLGEDVAEHVQPARPEDLVLIAYSSHGYVDAVGNFYLFPYDIGRETRGLIDQELLRRTVSSAELAAWLRDVDAGEFVLVVDACHSAAGVEGGGGFKPGPMGSRGLGQLAYDKGMRILASTRADDLAWEAELPGNGGRSGQGLLSYALVQEGLAKNKADYEPEDGVIRVPEWLGYAVQRVPGLYADVLAGKFKGKGRLVRMPRNRGAVVVVDESESPPRGHQQPALFDFKRSEEGTIIATTGQSRLHNRPRQ